MALKDLIPTLHMTGLKAEITYKDGEGESYGTAGGARADIILRGVSGVIAVFDLKTGAAILGKAQADNYKKHFGKEGGPAVKVFQIKPSAQ